MASIKKRVWLKDQKRGYSGSDLHMTTGAVDYEQADPAWSCNRKKAYSDEKFASRVARQMYAERGALVVAYACRHCGHYHIGRAPS
jgi:hypothetical protein